MLTILSHGAAELGLELTPRQLDLFERYYALLSTAGRRAGVTSVTAYEDVQRRHFLESLAVASALIEANVLDWSSPVSLLDVGAGGGLPGLPIKILLPHLRLTLLEASTRKSAFLRELVERLDLEGIEILTDRAEDLGRQETFRDSIDVVVARAVAPLSVLLELALPLLRVGGHLATPKGSGVLAQVEEAGRALDILGGVIVSSEPLRMPGSAQQQTLVLVRKTMATPERYPRRAGIPKKRPL
jgi:16S rRNA (guanine527-N7)-methyltransferase